MDKTKTIKSPIKPIPQLVVVKKKFDWRKIMFMGTVSSDDILFFTKNLSIMLKAGSTLIEAIDVLREQAKGKFKYILNNVYQEIEKGNRFSEALSAHPSAFSEIYVNILRIGEESGELEKNLEHLANQLSKSRALRKKVVGAMIYPAVVLSGGLLLTFGISMFVLPKVTNLFKNFKVPLPWSTRLLMWVSDFFQQHGILAFSILIGSIIFLSWFLRLKIIRPATHWLFLKIPVVKGVVKNVNLAMFYRTLSILLESGVTIDDGLKICTNTVSNLYYKNFLINAHTQIKAGGKLNVVLKEEPKLFSSTDVQIIRVGEESGTLGDSLGYCSSIHEEEVDNTTKNLATILEPILLLVIGFMVGFLALSIITPIYSITGQIRG